MDDFFHNFDYLTAGIKISSLGTARGGSDIFAEAINAFFFRLKKARVPFSELTACLGAPNRLTVEGGERVAEYDWEQLVSGVVIHATTRFLVVDDSVVRVLPSPA